MARMSAVEAVRRFNRFYTTRIGVLHASYLGTPFPLPQARVLYEIGHRGECTASGLGAHLDLDLGYLSRMLQALRRQGFVQGEAAKHDARQVRLSLTAKGRKAFAALDEGSRRATAEMLAPLPGTHRRTLMQAMHTVQHVLEPQATTGEVTLRAHRPGDMGWVLERHGVLYEREYGWGALFEALVADILARFLREFDAKRERCWIAERRICDHVERVGSVFIVKENRSYDQVLGDLERGNGDPTLTSLPELISPNHHELARHFVTLDNFYASGEVSGDGWNWSTGARATDSVEKTVPVEYAGHGLDYTFEGGGRHINTGTASASKPKCSTAPLPLAPSTPKPCASSTTRAGSHTLFTQATQKSQGVIDRIDE